MLILSLPATYTLELTPACSNRCPACSNHFTDLRSLHPLPFQQWSNWMAGFGPRAARIRLSGGEPTLHPDFPLIFDQACSYDALVTVFTNARWRDPQNLMAHIRKQKNLAGLLVSLHGARPDTHEAYTGVRGSFWQTIENIDRARDLGIQVALSIVLSTLNMDEMEEVAALGEKMGVEHIAFNRYLGPGSWQEQLPEDQLRMVMKRIEAMIEAGRPVRYAMCFPQCISPNQSEGCMAGISQVTIDPWGNVRPCVYSPTIAGSLVHDRMAEIWHGPVMNRWRAWEPAGCPDCAAYPVCHGGCRASAELSHAEQDPLIRDRLESFSVERTLYPLPLEGRPRHNFKIEQESFGYLLIGNGEIWPVRAEALRVLSACDGQKSIADLRRQFTDQDIELIQELWNSGLVDID